MPLEKKDTTDVEEGRETPRDDAEAERTRRVLEAAVEELARQTSAVRSGVACLEILMLIMAWVHCHIFIFLLLFVAWLFSDYEKKARDWTGRVRGSPRGDPRP